MTTAAQSTDTLLVVSDAFNLHCITEGHLDVWWRSLDPDRKAALFEAELEGVLDTTAERRTQDIASFLENSHRFLSEMERLQKSPFTGLITATAQEVTDASV